MLYFKELRLHIGLGAGFLETTLALVNGKLPCDSLETSSPHSPARPSNVANLLRGLITALLRQVDSRSWAESRGKVARILTLRVPGCVYFDGTQLSRHPGPLSPAPERIY